MDIKEFTVEVVQTVKVTLDADAFTAEFMSDFQRSFYPFDTIEEHAEHIAQLQARGVIDIEWSQDFIEGYGDSKEMGLKAFVTATETELAP